MNEWVGDVERHVVICFNISGTPGMTVGEHNIMGGDIFIFIEFQTID
jgi:hypothetical protein